MHKPVIAITGANGFIGSSLLQYFYDSNYPVIALVRNPSFEKTTFEKRLFDLQQQPADNLLAGVDILIHCAFIVSDAHPQAEQLNYEGTKSLINCARKNGVKKIIFFSTVSAHAHAVSAYAKSKHNTETLFDTQNDVIVKSSLVIGNGGLFLRIVQHVLSKRFVPLIGKGQQPLQIITIDDTLKAVQTIIDQHLTGTFILANREQYTYRSFFRTVARIHNKRILLVSVPVLLLKVVIYVAGLFKITLPINKDNIQGLQAIHYIDPVDSLNRLQLSPLSLEEKLKSMHSPLNG